MPERDPVTQIIINWARRSAVSAGRNEIDVPDLLCGFFAASRSSSDMARLIARFARGGASEVRWPDDITDLYQRAASISDPGEMSLSAVLRPVIARVYRQSPALDHERLVRAVLDLSVPLVEKFRQLNPEPKRIPLTPLVQHLTRANEAAQHLADRLNQVVMGQEAAVRMLANAYFEACIGLQPPRGPRGIFTFLGPPGVGKTLLAETFAAALAEAEGSPLAFKRFDMSLYAGHQQHEDLFGASEFYKGARPGTLTGFVAENPRSVILFDEIEKAHDNTIQALLAILDKGVAADKNLKDPVRFDQCFVIFTTNLGREFFASPNRSGFLRDIEHSPAVVFEILGSARRYREVGEEASSPALPPEFVSRLAKGGAVVFRRLETRHLLDLTRKGMAGLASDASPGQGPVLPHVTLHDPVPLLFLMSLLPNLDARQVVARSRAWAVELLRRAFEECREEIAAANPERFGVTLRAGPDALQFLEDRFREVEIRILVVDDDDYLPPFIEGECSDYRPRVHRITSRDDVTREVRRFDPTLVLLDLSIDESSSSARVERGLAVLQRIRDADPDLPVFLFSEHPERRTDFDRVVRRVLSHGGARGFWPFRGTLEDRLRADEFAKRLRDALDEARTARILNEVRRMHKTLSLRTSLRWEDGGVLGVVDDPHEQVVVRAEDQVATIRFAGIPSETLDDVVGLKRVKRRLAEVARWLRRPQDLAAFGLTPPRGFLLAGPPGTGKTFLARCFAGEARLPFLALSAGELKSRWYGESEERVREVFERAREYAPAIVFVDEIDAVGLARGSSYESEGGRGILTQLLACMDGLPGGGAPIFVLAATNRAEDLDPALLRPGRFDEVIPLDAPNAEARRTFFERRLAGRLADGGDIAGLVARTSGMTPAELDRIVREAAYRAAGEGRSSITQEDLEAACRLVRFGAEHEDLAMREEERRRTAWHEAGHALVHRLLFPEQTLDYLTILPHERGMLGFMAWLPDETRHDITRAEVRARLQVLLAGREAERLLEGEKAQDQVTTGAASDLRVATDLASRAITEWGLDDEVGPLSLSALPGEFRTSMGERLGERVRHWLLQARNETQNLLDQNRSALDHLALMLLARETLEGPEVDEAIAVPVVARS